MYTVVIDTSVVVSAARSRRGAAFQIFEWFFNGRVEVALSPALTFEYEMLLRRQAMETGWSDGDVMVFLDAVCHRARRVRPHFRLRPMLTDPDDESVLELAFAAGVSYIVTLNAKDFRGERFGVAVITPGDFAKLMRERT